VNQLLSACAELSGKPNFGLDMVHLVDQAMLGTFAFLLENAGTVDEFFIIAARYYKIFYRGSSLVYTKNIQQLYLRYQVEKIEENICQRHDNEWTLGFFVHFLQRKLGDSCVLENVRFSHQEPQKLAQHYMLFGENILFDQESTELLYSISIKDKKLNYSDPNLLKILREYAEGLLKKVGETNEFSDKVRLLINENLADNNITIVEVANLLCMSTSALKRVLVRENTSFRQLRQDVITKLARDLLLNSTIQISEIAIRLGYSESSVFCRNFSQHHQLTPNQYRAKNS